jgi:hypothetical protein
MASKGNRIEQPPVYSTSAPYGPPPVFAPAPVVVYGDPRPFGYWAY